MALFKAKVLYDFSGEPNTAEISISAGEILTVTRIDIGEGWWEGLNSRGISGLFPEAYVEKMEASGASHPPNMPPPPMPPTTDWGDQDGHNEQYQQDDDWDADSDDDNYSQIPHSQGRESHYANEPNSNNQFFNNKSAADNISQSSYSMDNKGGTKKNFNIFSTYVKSGLESYILGTLKSTPSSRVQIIRENDNTFRWPLITDPYTVQVTSPKKATKMGGLKTFIAYQLTPSFSNIAVLRRYKHFDWLHDRLSEKFNVIAIPPLPDKQISGRYEDQFIEHRRVQLQEFVNYMCRHPVLSHCDVWMHFLTCTNDKEWKDGKRKAEKDQFVGANFCLTIEAPEKELLNSTIEMRIESSNTIIGQIDQTIKVLMQCATDQQKKNETMFKREQGKVAESFLIVGNALQQSPEFHILSNQIAEIGKMYAEVSSYYGVQSKIDWQPLADKLYLYRGITNSFSDIFSIHKSADQKKKECERSGQMQQVQIGEIRRRTDVLTYAVFAELDHFHREINSEFKNAMREFVKEQVNFYKKIVMRFERTLDVFQ